MTLHGLQGKLNVSVYDPLADRRVSVHAGERAGDAVTLDLPTLDTPRLLVIEEED